MFVVYILINTIGTRTYVGHTNNVEKRLMEHNSGQVTATKAYRPWSILFTESIDSLSRAKHRELYWKSGAGRKNITRIMEGFPPRFRKRGEARLN